MMKTKIIITIFSASLLFAASIFAAPRGDEKLPVYKKTGTVSGTINSIGSDTMNNLMTLWAEAFAKFHPGVKVQVEGKGSSTAPPALIAGTSQFGPMSRAMKNEEVDKFEKKFGYKPTAIKTSIDALAVYVNKDNPIKSLSLQHVDAIFSKTRRGNHTEDIQNWGQAGLTGIWAQKPISLYGRNSASGTYGYFKKTALFKGDYKNTVKEQPGSASVVQGITEDKFGIGYSGIGYITSGVRAIALSKKTGEPAFGPEIENVMAKKYPLARFLYLYVNKTPGKNLSPLTHEFLKFVLSKQGQEIVVKDGYMPLSAKIIQDELSALQ
ncbi:MAG: phosphate ABC transporter substrate-binding protein [Calditrichaeota bacterium]|nr:MAG: phosphate ABC transporter substrate-binding protein [Calditrichota bacterium]